MILDNNEKNIIIIGSSTGGPKLLNKLFSELPPLNASIIIVQHVPPVFDGKIAERLDSLSAMDVKLAQAGEPPEAEVQSPQSLQAGKRREVHRLLHAADADIFDPRTNSWVDAAEMKYARWYPTNTTLPDGRVLVMGGTDGSYRTVSRHEIYDPSDDSWTRLPKKHWTTS